MGHNNKKYSSTLYTLYDATSYFINPYKTSKIKVAEWGGGVGGIIKKWTDLFSRRRVGMSSRRNRPCLGT
jgi:hypothetical protein